MRSSRSGWRSGERGSPGVRWSGGEDLLIEEVLETRQIERDLRAADAQHVRLLIIEDRRRARFPADHRAAQLSDASTIPSAACRRTSFISIWTSTGAAGRLRLVAHSRVVTPMSRRRLRNMASISGAMGVPILCSGLGTRGSGLGFRVSRTFRLKDPSPESRARSPYLEPPGNSATEGGGQRAARGSATPRRAYRG